MKVLVMRAQVVEIPQRVVGQWMVDQQVGATAYLNDPLRLADDFIADTWVEYSHAELLSEDGSHVESAHVLDETVWVEEFTEQKEEART